MAHMSEQNHCQNGCYNSIGCQTDTSNLNFELYHQGS